MGLIRILWNLTICGEGGGGVREGDGWGWEVAVVWRGVCGLMRLVLAGWLQGGSVLEREAEKEALSLSIYISRRRGLKRV
jgi:hypothetical protein